MIDAATGAAGLLYRASTNNVCGFPGYTDLSVSLLTEFVSLPWRLRSRGPDLGPP